MDLLFWRIKILPVAQGRNLKPLLTPPSTSNLLSISGNNPFNCLKHCPLTSIPNANAVIYLFMTFAWTTIMASLGVPPPSPQFTLHTPATVNFYKCKWLHPGLKFCAQDIVHCQFPWMYIPKSSELRKPPNLWCVNKNTSSPPSHRDGNPEFSFLFLILETWTRPGSDLNLFVSSLVQGPSI